MNTVESSPYVRLIGDKTRLISDWLKDHGAFFNRSDSSKGWYLPAEHLDSALAQLDEVEFTPEELAKIEKSNIYVEELEKLGPLDQLDHIELLPYNDKSFVLVGRTRPYEGDLKNMKGRYFKSLRGFTFANKHYDIVVEWLETNDYGRREIEEKKVTKIVKRRAPPK